jgi:methyl-accepting chemotaxis protein
MNISQTSSNKKSFLGSTHNIKLSKKLPIIIAGFALICGGSVTYYSNVELTKSYQDAASQKMFFRLQSKAKIFDSLMNNIKSDLETISTNPYIIKATKDLSNAYMLLGDDATNYLQNAYINNNSNKLHEKHLLDSANDDSAYSALHKKYHNYIRNFTQSNGYNDFFLVDSSGNVIYSMFKEPDFATNLQIGKWKDSGLAETFRSVMNQKNTSEVSFTDFKPYAPNNDTPAAFMGKPITDESGNYIGALIFQMPIKRINEIFTKDDSVGVTGNVSLIGADYLTRTQDRFSKENTILQIKKDIPEVKAALEGIEGTNLNATDKEGKKLITAWNDYQFGDTKYAILFEKDLNEVMQPVYATRNKFLLITGGIIAIITLLAAFVAKGVTRPIKRISEIMTQIARGDNIEVDYLNYQDEIGEMARSLEEVRVASIENYRIKLSLHTALSNVMIADSDYNIVYMNPSVISFLKESESDIKKDLPNFNVDNLIGQNIDVFHKNPAHQRGMLSKLTDTYKTSIIVGGRSFNLVAAPIISHQGEKLGVSVEWQDGSKQGIVDAITRSQAVIEFNQNGIIQTANENFLRTVGYNLDEIKGKHHSIFVAPEEASGAKYREFWEALNRGESQIGEFKRYTKSGKEIWIQGQYNAVLDLRGKTVRIVKTCVDITGEMARRREVALLSLVANETDNAVIITDANQKIEYVNPGFIKMTGYSSAEAIGKKPSDFLQGALTDKETKRQIREAINAGQPSYFEILNYTKTGEMYWVSLAINPIKGADGKVERFISIQANITETKKRALEASMRMEAVGRTNAVIEFDMNGKIIDANEIFLKVSGYTLEEIKGKHHSIFVGKEYAGSADYRQMWDALNRGENQVGEFKRFSKSGDEVWLNAAYNVILDLEGKPNKVVKFATDVTESVKSRIENEHGIKECDEILSGVANGVLTKRMEGEYQGAFKEIKIAVNATIDKLSNMVSEIIESARSVNEAASEISSGSVDLSQRTEQQASSLEETAASMEEITSTVKQNSTNATTANDLSRKASKVAADGGKVVDEAVSAMDTIENSSKKISDIIGVIDEIAFQTNLLALNAAVEAARAGDAGKGFAVVASEVRSLAGRSASASKEIKTLISESASQVQTGASLVKQAGDTLRGIVESVQQVAGIVSEIATASQEQAVGIDEVNTAITQMDEVTQQNAALVEQNTAAAQSMVEQARALETLMSFFSIDGENNDKIETFHKKEITFNPKLSTNKTNVSTPAKKTNGATKPKIAKTSVASKAVANGGSGYNDGWEEF